jgi:hypothetical protein
MLTLFAVQPDLLMSSNKAPETSEFLTSNRILDLSSISMQPSPLNEKSFRQIGNDAIRKSKRRFG